MNIVYKIFANITLLICCAICYGQQQQTNTQINNLNQKQNILQTTQDSIQTIINTQRKNYNTLNPQEKETIAQQIVTLEQELFNIRTELSKIGREISIQEEKLATQNLNSASKNNSAKEIYQNHPFAEKLTPQNIKTLQNNKTIEKLTQKNITELKTIYEKLKQTHTQYNNTNSQYEIDSLYQSAEILKNKIAKLDSTAGEKWNKQYENTLQIYALMLDMLPNVNRNVLEDLANDEKTIRQILANKNTNNIAKNTAAFNLQTKLIQKYETQIAKAAELEITNHKTTQHTEENNLTDILFEHRTLALYSDVITNYKYNYSLSSEVPQIIIPQKGTYYCVEIFTLPSQLKHLSSLKGLGPAQVYHTEDGKYTYTAGGFNSYNQAKEQVSVARKVGFKKPGVVCFLDGKITTTQKALESEKHNTNNQTYKVVLRTQNEKNGEILKKILKNQNLQNKSITRSTNNNELIFSVLGFDSSAQAETFANIVQEETSETQISIEEITL